MSKTVNQSRAEWAAVALDAFQERTQTDAEDVLSDLLCDLMHWAGQSGLDFEHELERANSHYQTEIVEDVEIWA